MPAQLLDNDYISYQVGSRDAAPHARKSASKSASHRSRSRTRLHTVDVGIDYLPYHFHPLIKSFDDYLSLDLTTSAAWYHPDTGGLHVDGHDSVIQITRAEAYGRGLLPRPLVSPGLMCSSLLPANAANLPILTRCHSIDTQRQFELIADMKSVDSFWRFDVDQSHPSSAKIVEEWRGALPCFWYRSAFACDACLPGPCYHVSTAIPNPHLGIPLRCAKCSLGGKPCTFTARFAGESPDGSYTDRVQVFALPLPMWNGARSDMTDGRLFKPHVCMFVLLPADAIIDATSPLPPLARDASLIEVPPASNIVQQGRALLAIGGLSIDRYGYGVELAVDASGLENMGGDGGRTTGHSDVFDSASGHRTPTIRSGPPPAGRQGVKRSPPYEHTDGFADNKRFKGSASHPKAGEARSGEDPGAQCGECGNICGDKAIPSHDQAAFTDTYASRRDALLVSASESSSTSDLGGFSISLPLIDASSAYGTDIRNLPAPGFGILADIAIILVDGTSDPGSSDTSPPMIRLWLRGTHLPLEAILRSFSGGFASRPTLSSRSFSLPDLDRVVPQRRFTEPERSFISVIKHGIDRHEHDKSSGRRPNGGSGHGFDDISPRVRDALYALTRNVLDPTTPIPHVIHDHLREMNRRPDSLVGFAIQLERLSDRDLVRLDPPVHFGTSADYDRHSSIMPSADFVAVLLARYRSSCISGSDSEPAEALTSTGRPDSTSAGLSSASRVGTAPTVDSVVVVWPEVLSTHDLTSSNYDSDEIVAGSRRIRRVIGLFYDDQLDAHFAFTIKDKPEDRLAIVYDNQRSWKATGRASGWPENKAGTLQSRRERWLNILQPVFAALLRNSGYRHTDTFDGEEDGEDHFDEWTLVVRSIYPIRSLRSTWPVALLCLHSLCQSGTGELEQSHGIQVLGDGAVMDCRDDGPDSSSGIVERVRRWQTAVYADTVQVAAQRIIDGFVKGYC